MGRSIDISESEFCRFLLTWEAMVAITLLQVVVTWISDDELQVWYEKCVVGNLFRGAHFCCQLT